MVRYVSFYTLLMRCLILWKYHHTRKQNIMFSTRDLYTCQAINYLSLSVIKCQKKMYGYKWWNHAPFNCTCMFCYIYSCIVLCNELKHNTNVRMLDLANAKNMSLRLTLRLISFTKIRNVIKLYVYLGISNLQGNHVYFCWNIFNYLKKQTFLQQLQHIS